MTLSQIRQSPVCGPVLIIVLAGALSMSGCSRPASETGSDEAPASADTGFAPMTPETMQSSGITLAEAGPAEVRVTARLYGSIKPDRDHMQEVRARYGGVVQSVLKRQGDSVRVGTPLLTVEATDSLQTYTVKSALDGTVLNRSINPGTAVDSSMVLFEIADLSSVWAEFAVFPQDLSHIRLGAAVQVTGVDGRPVGQTKIAYLAPQTQSGAQSVVARAVLDNSQRQWVAGQFVTAEAVISQETAPVAVVPAAIQSLDGQDVVFIRTDEGFEARDVSLGRRSDTAVEVTGGLSAGERYAAENSYRILAEMTKGAADDD